MNPTWLRLLCLIATGSGCVYGRQRVWVPPDIASHSERYPVSGHVELFRAKVKFGPYETTRAQIKAQTGMDSEAALINGQKETSTSRQEGSFQLRGPGGAQLRGDCVQSSRMEAQHELSLQSHSGGNAHLHDDVVSTDWHSLYRCVLMGPTGTPVELVIEDGVPVLRGGSRPLTLVRVNRAEDQPEGEEHGSAHGYLIQAGTETVAAVDLTEFLESVRLRNDLEQAFKDELAAICMALLLPRDMR